MGNGSYDIELTTTSLGMTIIGVVPLEDILTSGAYSTDDNTITFVGVLFSISGGFPDGDQTVSTATITELSDTALILAQEYTEEQIANGATTSFTINSEIVFTRI